MAIDFEEETTGGIDFREQPIKKPPLGKPPQKNAISQLQEAFAAQNPLTHIQPILDVINYPFEQAGHFIGEKVRSTTEPLGPNISAGLATLADIGTQFGTQGAAIKALGGLGRVLPRLLPLRGEKITSLEDLLNLGEQSAKQEAIKAGQEITLRRAQQAEKTGEQAARAVQTEVAPIASTAEEVGQKFVKETFPAEKAATRASFSKQYDDILSTGDTLPTELTNFKKVAGEIPKEAGVMESALPTQAERVAESTAAQLEGQVAKGDLGPAVKAISRKIGGVRNSMQVTEEAEQAVRQKLQGGTPGVPQHIDVEDLRKAAMGPVATPQTAGDALEGVLRLRAAKRAAINAGHTNIGRQFGEMENALLQDVEQASPKLKQSFDVVTSKYAKEFVPLYGPKAIPSQIIKKVREDVEQVVPSIIRPASDPHRIEAINRSFQILKNPGDRQAVTGAWLKGGIDDALNKGDLAGELPKWWDKYSDAKTGDHVLKTALGDKYQKTKEFIDTLRQAKADNFEKIADQAVSGAVKNRDAKISQLRDNYEKEVKALTDAPITGKEGRWIGTFQVLHGGAATLAGVVTGHPGAVTYGLANLGTGGLLLMTGPTFHRMLNTVRGAELLKRAARATPGTAEAATTAALISNFTRNLPKGTEAREKRLEPSTFPPDIRERLRQNLSPLPEGEG